MNNTYKLNAFTEAGLQELEHHDKSSKYISKNIKLTNKRKQASQNAIENLHNVYSKKFGDCSIEARVKQATTMEAIERNRQKKKEFWQSKKAAKK